MPEKNNIWSNQTASDEQVENEELVCWIRPGERLRAGMTCPRCRSGELAYNGLLQLTCPVCGLTEVGACT